VPPSSIKPPLPRDSRSGVL